MRCAGSSSCPSGQLPRNVSRHRPESGLPASPLPPRAPAAVSHFRAPARSDRIGLGQGARAREPGGRSRSASREREAGGRGAVAGRGQAAPCASRRSRHCFDSSAGGQLPELRARPGAMQIPGHVLTPDSATLAGAARAAPAASATAALPSAAKAGPSSDTSASRVACQPNQAPPKVFTLAVVRKGSDVILGWKKRGFGEGRLMGFGGKVESGESVTAAAKRELMEECGVQATRLDKRAEITFHFEGDPRPWLVHVYEVADFDGVPRESDEMRPQVFPVSDIPYDHMFPDDPIWLPVFLQGKAFKAEFWVSKDGSHMFKHKLTPLPDSFDFHEK